MSHGSDLLHLEIQVMVELGTGYFTEKNIPDSKELIDRKVSDG
jgi:prefoldin subunit 5